MAYIYHSMYISEFLGILGVRMGTQGMKNTDSGSRVAKCHEYNGYIHGKILAGWGKKFGRTSNFAKSSLFFGRIGTAYVIFCVSGLCTV